MDIASRVMDAMADPVIVIDGSARLCWANRAAEARWGWRVDELAGTAVDHLVHPDDHLTALASLESVQQRDEGSLIEIRVRDRRGAYAWFEVRGRVLDGPDDRWVVLNLRETTARRQWELAAGDPALLGALVDAAPAMLLVLDADGRIRSANRAVTRLLGRPIEDVLGTPFADLAVDPEHVSSELRSAAAVGTRSFDAVFASVAPGGVALAVTIVNLFDDQAIAGFLVSGTDIGVLAATRSELRHLATHDQLTGLPNRAWLQERLQRLLDATEHATHTLLFGDVDGLKPINDTAGHLAGDAVIAAVAERLRDAVREDDVVTRLGGDEFVILVASTDERVIGQIKDRIHRVLDEPISLPDGRRLRVGISLGAAPLEAGVTAEELIAAADAAMYVDKRTRTVSAS